MDDDRARQWIASAGAVFISGATEANPRILAWDLGAGETAVLSSALLDPEAVCVLDDRVARDCAAVFHLPTVGTAGVLVRAKRAGLLEAVGPELAALRAAGACLRSTSCRIASDWRVNGASETR